MAAIPAALQDRRVEITGPVDPKMVINALNSGAKVFMADFEDSTSPTWANLVAGQQTHDRARSPARSHSPRRTPNGSRASSTRSSPFEEQAVLIVRPRGWHLDEKHVRIDGTPIAGGLFDLAVFAFHNAKALAAKDRGPYFYLPKLQSMEEAALWETALSHIETALGLPQGQMKVTVLIETLPAVFEMDEILHALRGRIVGLNCGRWDYIFSYLKTFRRHRDKVLPERGQVTMTQPFLKAYSELLIQTCHRRGAHAMGGMAAQIPISGDEAANEQAMARVRADKLREVSAGHDGTWVAHPALIPIARAIFDAAHAGGEPARRAARGRQGQPRRPDQAVAGHHHPRRFRRQRRSLRALPGRVAGRQRLRADPLADGRRGHRRDLPHPAVAVAALGQPAPGRRHADRFRPAGTRAVEPAVAAGRHRLRLPGGKRIGEAIACSTSSATPTSWPSS